MNALAKREPAADLDGAAMANAVRALAMDAVERAQSGHPGMPMGMADVATVLFREFLEFDPSAPHWPDRDRFVLSAGHGSMLLYAINHLVGYPDMTIDEIKRFRKLGAITAGHPEYGHALGVETTTGPLGQGIATAVGMAIAERAMAARFGEALVDHRTYVIAGDGCLMEGISHEAIDLAGHLGLSRLVVLWDDNRITIDGSTSLSTRMDQRARFEAAGWRTFAVDGHDRGAVRRALYEAQSSNKPVLIACRTTIGFGSPGKQGTEAAHGAPLGAAEIAAARANLGWTAAPFEVPADTLTAWRAAGARGAPVRRDWEARLAASEDRAAFEAAIGGEMPAAFGPAMAAFRADLVAKKPKVATRKASEMALETVVATVPAALGGSADLTHSNLTITKGMASIAPGDFAGRYVRYGIREHGMAAAMNGIALHGGFVPYGGTFLAFADYARGAVRLSALMGLRVVYVFTHDSIGLGEDGPTHQPVEHLASLRAIPNLNVFRPCDAVETAECWELAMRAPRTPSALCLSRQNLPTLRADAAENRSARGAYVLREADGPRDVTLLATGSEVEIAMAAADLLAAEGVRAAVVSMPCWELFAGQDAAYRAVTLGTAPRVGVEAALGFGWERWTGDGGSFVGMSGFGASAPAGDLYKHFG
ncbi:MAG: transketolase, partial [Hyphomicrobiales bacterium]|nr:transketolase [Hyphomicrobiales bacterium]